jgi:parallel beta-helix repeat protein
LEPKEKKFLTKVASGILLVLLLMATVISAFELKSVHAWTGTVYVNADGSVSPPSAPVTRSGDLYTMSGDVSSDADGIVILKNNMTLNGAGYLVQGPGGGGSNGIYIESRSNLTIRNVRVEEFDFGISLNQSSNVNISENNVINNLKEGVSLYESPNNVLFKNNIANNWDGIELRVSNNNTICGNNIEANVHYGIGLCSSEGNRAYHNSFVGNTYRQVSSCADLTNIWCDNYPSCGNYWSDYTGVDVHGGVYQNETGGDGIGDTRYVIDENNSDRYPLMGSWTDAGENVSVTHPSGVSFLFSRVLSGGVTMVNESGVGPTLPLGFRHVSKPPVYYYIRTTANCTNLVGLGIVYDSNALTQLEENLMNMVRWNYTLQEWENITTRIEISNNVIYGETTDLSLFTLSLPLLGDINADGTVDIFDAITLSSAFGSKPGNTNWNPKADINSDGVVDIYDAIILANNYGTPT